MQLGVVLVASSLAEVGTQVVCQALALARAAGARAVLAHALHPTATDAGEEVEWEPGGDSAEAVTRSELTAQAATCPDRPDQLELRVVIGAAHRAIDRLAEEVEADLVVVGAREEGSLPKKLLGSTADRLTRRCSAPVLVVRGRLDPQPGRLLFPVDLSPRSVQSLERALALLDPLAPPGGILGTLLHVLGPKERELYPGDATQAYRRIDRELRLLAVRVHSKSKGISLETRVAEGDPCRVILDQSRYHEADWIVLGSHGRGGFERFLMGSVAADVVRESTIPVLVVAPVR